VIAPVVPEEEKKQESEEGSNYTVESDVPDEEEFHFGNDKNI